MTIQSIILNAIIDTVPQWYISNIGPHCYSIALQNSQVNYCSHRARTPDLMTPLSFANASLGDHIQVRL